jgi:phosphoenolpyruvate carboxykinase (ATP)
MLGKKIDEHGVQVFLVNTGWTGGGYGVGERMKLSYTRAMVKAAIDGTLDQTDMTADSIFGLHSPVHVPGVPDEVLQPENTWSDKKAYNEKALFLANEFKENFKKFSHADSIAKAGGPLV